MQASKVITSSSNPTVKQVCAQVHALCKAQGNPVLKEEIDRDINKLVEKMMRIHVLTGSTIQTSSASSGTTVKSNIRPNS